jgi:hypothetical protein
MACFRFRAQSQTQHPTQDFQSDFVAAVVSDLDLDVVFSSLFEVNCAGISGGQYAGTIFSAFFVNDNPTSIEFEIRSSESQFSKINRAMLLTLALYKKAEVVCFCGPVSPSILA